MTRKNRDYGDGGSSGAFYSKGSSYNSENNSGKHVTRSAGRKRKDDLYHQQKHYQQNSATTNQNVSSMKRNVVRDYTKVNFVNLPHMNYYWSEVSELLQVTEIDNVGTLVETLLTIQNIVYGSTEKGSNCGFDQFIIPAENRLTYLLNEESVQWEGRSAFFETVEFIKDIVLKTPVILGHRAKAEYYTHESQKQSTIQANDGMLPILGDLNQLPYEVESKCIKLTKLECLCILANSFFCTFPRIGDTRDGPEIFMPSINMDSLIGNPHEASASKLLMIIHYFERMNERSFEEIAKMGYVHFIRKRVDPTTVESLLLSSSDDVCTFSEIQIHPEGVIEDCQQALHADFANMYIGGGVLRAGAVQEEIRFVLSPETIVSRLFVERMADNESLLIIGTEQFSKHKGYGSSLLYGGDYVDTDFVALNEHLNLFNSQIIAFDSKAYKRFNILEQWQQEHIDREITKAYSAFCDVERGLYDLNIYSKISTGHWGCGAFLCDKQLKFVIQFIAASIAAKPLHYYTFGETEISEKMLDFVDFVRDHNFTVADIYEVLVPIFEHYVKPASEEEPAFYPDTFAYIKHQLKTNQQHESP